MNIFSYSTRNASEIISEFKLDFKNGLDKKTVVERMGMFGPNKLELKETTGWHIFIRQFKSSFIYLLLAAIIITVLLGEIVDTVMILIFIIINTGLGFFQEFRSEKTVQLLNKFALPHASVLRSGKILELSADQLVPGDVIFLKTGDKIPADARILEQNNLVIDETILTGESVSVYKKAEVIKREPSSYYEALNLVFSGTNVLKGKAKAIVIATGKKTAFGQISKLTGESRKVSDFEKGISKFSQFIMKLVGFTLLIFLLAHWLIGKDGVGPLELIIFSIALTVSVIPEALPLVTTFSLARGAKRLAKKNIIVKRLSAIEDLGGIEVLCSDKTGTLTKNELEIVDVYSNNREETIYFSNLAASFELQKKIEPFDVALEKGMNTEQKKAIKKAEKIIEEPFDPSTRYNLSLVSDKGTKHVIMRGAPEAVIDHCSINEKEKGKITEWIIKEGRLGHRVIATAIREATEANKEDFIKNALNSPFQLSGIISFNDPIKASTLEAVKQAKALGVRIVIITGDSLEVSGAVAHEIGLIESPENVMSGIIWEGSKKEKQLEYLKNYSVFARVSPEQKFSIINAMRERYMIGFLGEGINDAPALKVAGVSLVVDSASDIAREAADIILLKKNLTVIIDGIKEGRQVFANTTKYIKSTLASNFGNFFAVAISSLMIDFLPMLPIQILLLNLFSDTPMISISTDNVETSELKSPRKYEVKNIITIAIILGIVSTIFDFIFFWLFYRISPGVLQTNWFIGSVLTELALLFSIRTRSFFMKTLRPSTTIIALSIITVLFTIGLPFTAFGQNVFKFTAPTPYHLALIFSLVGIYFMCSEIVKLVYYKNFNKSN